MATLISLTSVGIGDVELFMPSPPCLVVNTFYVDGEPESSVTYVWQDEATGALKSELVYMQPARFEAALAWAEEHALTRNVERIHTRHVPKSEPQPARKAAAKRKPAAKPGAAKKATTQRTPARKPARKAPAKRRAAKKKARR
jgi:hypothetical protein